MLKQMTVNLIVPEGVELEQVMNILERGCKELLLPDTTHAPRYFKCRPEWVRTEQGEKVTILIAQKEQYIFPEDT